MRFNGLDLQDMFSEIEDLFYGDWYIYKVTGSKVSTMSVHFTDPARQREIVWRDAEEGGYWTYLEDVTILATAPTLEFLYSNIQAVR